MTDVLQNLEDAGGSVDFAVLFSGRRTRRELIASFIALLELIRLGRVQAHQEGAYGRILLRLRSAEEVP